MENIYNLISRKNTHVLLFSCLSNVNLWLLSSNLQERVWNVNIIDKLGTSKGLKVNLYDVKPLASKENLQSPWEEQCLGHRSSERDMTVGPLAGMMLVLRCLRPKPQVPSLAYII
jgi:hypothetical protein